MGCCFVSPGAFRVTMIERHPISEKQAKTGKGMIFLAGIHSNTFGIRSEDLEEGKRKMANAAGKGAAWQNVAYGVVPARKQEVRCVGKRRWSCCTRT